MTLRARALFPTLLLCAAPGCFFWPATVDPTYRPQSARQLNVAGIHAVNYSVVVLDERLESDTRDVGKRRGNLLAKPSVRTARDVAAILAEALSNELRARDLSVVANEAADVLLEVRLEEYYVTGSGGDMIGPEGGEARAYAEGVVRVVDVQSGTVKLELPVAARSVQRSILLTARKYEWALSEVAGEFARRAARHPDVLIAIQSIAGVE